MYYYIIYVCVTIIRLYVLYVCIQVSGEYAMLWHGSVAGAFDLQTIVCESVCCMRRAGKAMMMCLYVFCSTLYRS